MEDKQDKYGQTCKPPAEYSAFSPELVSEMERTFCNLPCAGEKGELRLLINPQASRGR
jgi:hypothetical protein